MKVNLGSNLIVDCDAALVINGVEVFRLRELSSDGRLVCDFDLRKENGDRIAKIAKSRVVYATEGYELHDLPNECYIKDSNGNTIARVQGIGRDEIAITGNFWVEGHHVLITDNALVSGGVTMSGSRISGFGRAISIEPNSFAIGTR